MALDESKKEEFKQRLDSMSEEDIQLELDMDKFGGGFDSLARQKLERLERERRERSELAKARREIDNLKEQLVSAQSKSGWTKAQVYMSASGWVVALILYAANFLK